MPSPAVMLAALAAGLIWWGSISVVHGVEKGAKKVGHAIVHVLKHGVRSHEDPQ